MIEVSRILWPTDFSVPARHALEQAALLARWYDAKITALHVALPYMPPASDLPLPPSPAIPDSELQELTGRLRAECEGAASGIPCEAVVRTGHPVDCVITGAAESADLVVMGTHGATGFRHLMLGSVTEKVLRGASCPVLTVPPRLQDSSPVPFRRIVCAIDAFAPTLRAVNYACSLAQEAPAEVTLLHVVEWPWKEPPGPSLEELPAREALALAEFRINVERQARTRLEALVPADVHDWCAVKTEVRHGKPYREILRVANESRADLIVTGVQRNHALGRAVFGSTTNHIVRSAACPVLTVRE